MLFQRRLMMAVDMEALLGAARASGGDFGSTARGGEVMVVELVVKAKEELKNKFHLTNAC